MASVRLKRCINTGLILLRISEHFLSKADGALSPAIQTVAGLLKTYSFQALRQFAEKRAAPQAESFRGATENTQPWFIPVGFSECYNVTNFYVMTQKLSKHTL